MVNVVREGFASWSKARGIVGLKDESSGMNTVEVHWRLSVAFWTTGDIGAVVIRLRWW